MALDWDAEMRILLEQQVRFAEDDIEFWTGMLDGERNPYLRQTLLDGIASSTEFRESRLAELARIGSPPTA